jgi:hypothetical protein
MKITFLIALAFSLGTALSAQKTLSCEGKEFNTEAGIILEKRNGEWVQAGNRSLQLNCIRRRVFSKASDSSLWRYNGEPGNWTPANTLLAGQFLNGGSNAGDGMHLQSANGKYILCMQENGDLGIWTESHAPALIWNSKTFDRGPNCTLLLQEDGNLLATDSKNHPIWNSETNKNADPCYADKKYKAIKAELENDGRLVLYSITGFRVWDNVNGKYPLK